MADATERPSAAPGHLVLGLGNPGDRYRETRHNLGFRVVEALASRLGVAWDGQECQALVARRGELTLALPQTYMNRSGYAARCLLERHGLSPGGVLVVYDDIELPLGRLRMRGGGRPAGHRGMESIIRNLRTDRIARLRLGIRPADREPASDELVDFVLAPFERAELEEVERMVERGVEAIAAWLEDGIEKAMNLYNR